MSKLKRRVDGNYIKYNQILMIVMKHETSYTDSEGNTKTKTCIEPLFCALVQDKKKTTYIQYWRHLIELHQRYYPAEGRLTPGKFSILFLAWTNIGPQLSSTFFSLKYFTVVVP